MMKTLKVLIVPLWIITLAAVACMKKAVDEQPPHPEMHYNNLKAVEISPNTFYHVDMDNNGNADFTFHTQLVADPILQRERLQFIVVSKIQTNLLGNEQDETPRLSRGDRIGTKHEGFNWFEVSTIVLAEKMIYASGENHWEGMWKTANHHFLPVQVLRDAKVYHGWIEISFDQNNKKLILHKTGISVEINKDIRAGY